MKFAFCLFKYFSYGGLQKNFLKIAKLCIARGHQVDAFVFEWKGDVPKGLNVFCLSNRYFSNHSRLEGFIKDFNRYLVKNQYDFVVGFNKMPGLDLYYAADTCFAAKAYNRSFFYRLTRRCRKYMQFEEDVFGEKSKTKILLIARREEKIFAKYYGTCRQRFYLLPPGISKNFVCIDNAYDIRNKLRYEFGLNGSDKKIILMVGSGFKTKGVDRAIYAVSSLPSALLEKTVMLIAGIGNVKPFKRLAKRLGIADKLHFLGGRNDILRFFVGADILLHPARMENTGNVLIEAMASGLPVLATDICGYACHIRRAKAGKLIPSPSIQKKLNQMLAHMLLSDECMKWKKNGINYIAQNDVFSRSEKAADIIERMALC